MKVVSVINYKGGVGKTTLVSNLAAYAADQGKRVLMIDLDPQMSLTFSFMTVNDWEKDYAAGMTLKNFFDSIITQPQTMPLGNLIIKKFNKNNSTMNSGRLNLISSHLELIDIDITLASTLGGATPFLFALSFLRCYDHIRNALDKLKNNYDLVIMDCPPNFSAVVKNAITASDYCVIPAKLDYLSTLGATQLRNNLNKYREEYAIQLKTYNNGKPLGATKYDPVTASILGIVPTMVNVTDNTRKTIISTQQQFMDDLRKAGFDILPWIRNNSSLFGAVPANGIPVVLLSYMKWLPNFLGRFNTIKTELEELGREFMQQAGI